MYPDREYRFVLATLDPMPSLNEAGWYIAIQHAMNDAEAAGLDAANDPGVRLLRLKSTTTQSASVENPEMTELQNICQRRLAELRREPTLALIGSYDIASDDKLKQWFHADPQRRERYQAVFEFALAEQRGAFAGRWIEPQKWRQGRRLTCEAQS